jgi:hypothetical protein
MLRLFDALTGAGRICYIYRMQTLVEPRSVQMSAKHCFAQFEVYGFYQATFFLARVPQLY